MGKLNVLGVKRVESLIEILNDKKKQELDSLGLIGMVEAEKQAREELGVYSLREERDKLIEQANEFQKRLNEIEGKCFEVKPASNYNLPRHKDHVNKRANEIMKRENGDKREKLNQKYKAKEQRLWLCETLEEAKEIVGIE